MKMFWKWLLELDQILRGEATRVTALKDGSIQISARGISLVLVILGSIYGLCMAVFAVRSAENYQQLGASAVKVPALFLLTLLVTLPSLYVFTALVNARLSLRALVRLFVAAIGVNIAVLSSLGPIVAFFALNTLSYNFMVLLNVVVFGVSGVLGLSFLLQTLHRMNIAPRFDLAAGKARLAKLAEQVAPPTPRPAGTPEQGADFITPEVIEPASGEPHSHQWLERLGTRRLSPEEPPAAAEAEQPKPPAEPTGDDGPSGPLDPVPGHVLGRHTRLVFDCWLVLFGLVGAQMSWVLRPFIGSPDQPFAWFRPAGSNFFEAVFQALHSLLSK